MSNFINKIKSIKHVEFSKGATKEQVRDAEKTLQLKFPKDYSDYLNVFGCISFFGTEWTGLNGADYLNVVDATAEARETYSDFPINMFIIEDLGFDGYLILSNTKGDIFEWQHGNCTKIYTSLEDYLNECLERIDQFIINNLQNLTTGVVGFFCLSKSP